MFIVVIMLERKIRHKYLQVLLTRRVPEDMFFVYMLLLFFHTLNSFQKTLALVAKDFHTF